MAEPAEEPPVAVPRARHMEAMEAAEMRQGSKAAGDESKPCLYYFPFAGRGELTRLIAAAGDLEIDELPEVTDKASFGSPGALPVLAHGELKVAQSFAIETYIATVAPAFSGLDSAQRAIDGMFCKIKEDVLQSLDDIILDLSKNESAAEDISTVCDRCFPSVESRLPEDGFINGLNVPTAADLAVFNMAKAFMPFGAAYRMGGYDLSARCPKFAAHASRVAEHPTVKAYVERSATMMADPLDLMSRPSAEGKVQAMKISALATETAGLWHSVNSPVPDCAVVWLHSLGETEVYWQELFEECDVLNIPELGECRWIMPRADIKPCTARGGAPTAQWFDTPEYPVCIRVPGVPNRARKEEDTQEIHAAVHRVHEAVLALEVEGVSADRIVVAGFGQGGALAVHAALSYPKKLAGCAMLSGYVPCCETALAHSVTSSSARGLELLWLHGIHDAVVHVDAATFQAKFLTDLGICLDFRLGFDYGHEVTTEELQSFRSWLLAKLRENFEEEAQHTENTKTHLHEAHALVETHTLPQDPWGAPQRPH